MKTAVFASRNVKEIVRDPLSLFFGIAFPLILLLLLSMIQRNVPVELFVIESLAPGVAVFGLSFVALFSATLISKDRTSSLLMRLFASPVSARGFILGYTLPLVPMAFLQGAVCFLASAALGLKLNANILLTLVVLIPSALLFIGIGLLCGSLLNDKQVGGICGALLTNLSAWLSGIWFDLELVGGAFSKVAKALPFYHAVESARAATAGDYAAIMPHLWWVIAYAVVVLAVAIIAFRKKMKE